MAPELSTWVKWLGVRCKVPIFHCRTLSWCWATGLAATSGGHQEHWLQCLTSRTACVCPQPQLGVFHQVLLQEETDDIC